MNLFQRRWPYYTTSKYYFCRRQNPAFLVALFPKFYKLSFSLIAMNYVIKLTTQPTKQHFIKRVSFLLGSIFSIVSYTQLRGCYPDKVVCVLWGGGRN